MPLHSDLGYALSRTVASFSPTQMAEEVAPSAETSKDQPYALIVRTDRLLSLRPVDPRFATYACADGLPMGSFDGCVLPVEYPKEAGPMQDIEKLIEHLQQGEIVADLMNLDQRSLFEKHLARLHDDLSSARLDDLAWKLAAQYYLPYR